MNFTQLDTYMDSILSRITQEEKEETTDGENLHPTPPPSTLDLWLHQIQSMMNEDASSVSSVSNLCL